MKSYELFLHWKQGDDFHHHIKKNSSTSEAFSTWGETFEHRRDVCRQLAVALKDQNIDVVADVHIIMFTPKDHAAEQVLEALVKEKVLYPFDDGLCEDEDDDFSDDTCQEEV